MDFKRVEWIFLVAFLGLNMFLFSIYHERLQTESSMVASTPTQGIEERLKKDDIGFPGSFSSEKREGYYLSAEQSDMNKAIRNLRDEQGDSDVLKGNTTVTDNVATSYPTASYVIDVDEPEDSLNNFLHQEQVVLFGTDYTYMPNLSTLSDEKNSLVLAQSFEGIPFEDDTSKMEITLEKQEDHLVISKYSSTHISDIEKLREKMELISEREAVNTLYVNNKIPAKAKILWVQLAYSRIYQVHDKNVYVPVWFVEIETEEKGRQIESVHAINKTIMTGNLVRKVEN